MYQRFYQQQLRNDLGCEEDRQHFAVVLKPSLDRKWIPHIIKAIHSINEAAPGLDLILYYTKTSSTKYRTIVIEGTTEDECYTRGNVRKYSTSTIKLTNQCDRSFHMASTSVHELLHALGFEHEHQRRDAEHYVFYTGTKETDEEWDQCVPEDDVYGLTVFDPFSIMMYPEDEKLRRNEYNPIWFLKPDKERSTEMSELDKVGLNLLYPPCRSPDYNPVISEVTQMWYCGRPVMQNHNQPAESITDGRCGPNGVNCPACRTLKNAYYYNDLFLREGRWQGWSGLVYCGKHFGVQEPGHDGYCGPNNGPHCPECARFLRPKGRNPRCKIENLMRFSTRDMTFKDMMTTPIFLLAAKRISQRDCTAGYRLRHI